MIGRVGIIGCGHFGYALALLLSRHHPELDIGIHDVDEEVIDELSEKGRHPYFHTDFELPENVTPSHEQSEVVENSDLVVMAVPAQYMRGAAESIQGLVTEDAVVLNVAKALESGSDLRMSEVLQEVLGDVTVATMSGGMLADDVSHGRPVGAEIGCSDESALELLEELFKPTTVKVDITTDIVGVEFSGSFKNVIAIGAGVFDGLGLGASSKAFFISQALGEVEGLAVSLGARRETFHTSSHAWIGDLLTTCYGDSRNRYFGELRGKGVSTEDAVEQLEREKKHAEGLATLEVVHELLQEKGIDAPFMETLYEVVHEGADPGESFKGISRA